MKPIKLWLDEYKVSHQHPVNIAIHKFAIPLIMLSTLGLLWHVPLLQVHGRLLNWSVLLCIGLLAFYLRLSFPLFLGMIALLSCELSVVDWVDRNIQAPLWLISTIVFVLAWIAQFVGHLIEGKKPSFTQDLAFLAIGPLWVIAPLYRRL